MINFKKMNREMNKDVNVLLNGFHTKSQPEQDVTIRDIVSHVAQVSYNVGKFVRNGVLFNMHRNIFQLFINDDPIAYIHHDLESNSFVSISYNDDPNQSVVYHLTVSTTTLEEQIIELSNIFMCIMTDMAEEYNFIDKFDVKSIEL